MDEYDFIIVGSGVTGLAAGMYSARLGLKTLILGATQGSELSIGGVITTTNNVENYPGFAKLTGTELAKKIEDHAREYELLEIKEEKVEEVNEKAGKFIVKTAKEKCVGKTVLFAMGTKWRKLEIPGGKEFENKGVVYCALCDAPLFKNKVVAVIGGGDTAAKDALVVAEHAKKVYMIVRKDKLRAEPINIERVEKNEKIEIIFETNVLEVKGGDVVKSIVLDKEYSGKTELEISGVFVAIGHVILSDIAKSIGVELNKKNEIVIDHKTSETNVKGIYAAGDVADKPFKQAITGVAEGCTAAYSAFEYIRKGQ